MADIQLKIEERSIQEQIKEVIHAQVLSALTENGTAMMSSFIESVLRMKVDNSGKVSSDTYYNRKEYITWLSEQAIKASIEEAIKEWVETQKQSIKKEVRQKLNSSRKKIVTDLSNQIVDGLDKNFYSTVSIRVKGQDD